MAAVSNKISNGLKLILFTIVLGAVSGGVIWCFLKAVAVCSGLFRQTLSTDSFSFLPIIICGALGAVVGVLHRKYGDYPDELSVVMNRIKKEKYYDYRHILPMIVCAFVPLVCLASVGPEAALTGIIAALCYWTGDNVSFAKNNSAQYSEIGEAVALGQLFHSPLFGIFAVEETPDGEDGGVIPALTRGQKLLYYALSVGASFLVVGLLNRLFGEAMEGFPSFSDVTIDTYDYVMMLIYIPVGVLIRFVFEFFEKVTKNAAGHIPVIIREAACGIVIGFTVIAFPMAMSSGEEEMAHLMGTFTEYVPASLALICVIKLFMTAFCINFGMKGGHFFPLIFSCTCMGFALSSLIFSQPAVHAPFAAAVICATVLGAMLKKPVAVSLLLLLCFPMRLLLCIFVCAAIGSRLGTLFCRTTD
ncbi:MAG: chloride channel protein [Lachnospiraceae bacterium]|nr:chloride channel protein [Lachnospiraceae bacterium]